MPAAYPCPNGHDSTDPEYCSECGKKLSGAPAAAAAAAASAGGTLPSASGGQVCPDCATPRASPTAVFCEVCRYNFVTGMPWSPAGAAPTVVPLSTPPPGIQPTSVVAQPVVGQPTVVGAPLPDPTLQRWDVVATVDPSLYADPDPAMPCPVGEPNRVFPIDFAENLIGRRSERRGIFPEIDLSGDHGVSSRHAIIYREAAGLMLLDVGSTNGTQLNGVDVAVGVRNPLANGDQITAGCWTRLTVRLTTGGAESQP